MSRKVAFLVDQLQILKARYHNKTVLSLAWNVRGEEVHICLELFKMVARGSRNGN